MADQDVEWKRLYEEEKEEKEQMAQEQLEAEETWKELENELEKEIDDLTKEKNRAVDECADLKMAIENERDKRDELSKQLDRAQDELRKLQSSGSDSRATVQKLEQENDSLSQRDRINQASLKQVKEQLETVQEEKFLLEQQLMEIENDSKQKFRTFEEQLVEAKGDVEVKDALVHKLQTKINVMEALGEDLAIAKADKEKDSMIQELQTRAEDSDALRTELSEAKKQLAAKDSMIETLQTKVQETEQQLAKAKSQASKFKASTDSLPKDSGTGDSKDEMIQNLQSQLNDTDKLREELAVNIRKTLIQKFQAGVKALGNQLTKAKRDLKAKDSLVQQLQRSLGAQLAKAKSELEVKNAQIKKLKKELESGNVSLMSIPDAFQNEIASKNKPRENSSSRGSAPMTPPSSARKQARRPQRTPSSPNLGSFQFQTPTSQMSAPRRSSSTVSPVRRHFRTNSSGISRMSSGSRSHFRTNSSGQSTGSSRRKRSHRVVRSEIPASFLSNNRNATPPRISLDQLMARNRVYITLNSRVKVWWSKNQVYSGVVTAWHNNRCTVTYDDGDVKSYDKRELEQRVMLAGSKQ